MIPASSGAQVWACCASCCSKAAAPAAYASAFAGSTVPHELAKARPGLAVEGEGAQLRLVIPDRYRVGHEAHFGQVATRFFSYLKKPA